MQIGRKLYYDRLTGDILIDTGERSGDVSPTTLEYDFTVYSRLSDRVPETVGVLELDYGQYVQDFAECTSYRVDPETKELLFSYPDPNQPEEPNVPVYQKSLTEQIATLQQRTEANEAAILALLDFGL